MPTELKEILDKRKISPKGVITLPPTARELLQFTKGTGKRIGFVVEKDRVTLSPAAKENQPSKKVSPRGLVKLNKAANEVLNAGNAGSGRYKVGVEKNEGVVHLYPAN